jgi:hypothetical protein
MTPRIPGRRRRRPTAVIAGLAIAGLVAMAIVLAGLAASWVRRRDASDPAHGHRPGDAAFDTVALDRASGEGMAPAPDPGDTLPTNGFGHEPVPSGGLARLV